ncbi:MAG: transglycosylase domain-containing protein [Massiliimalia sp.]|jgi:monofunctional glycosyltransferase
MNLIKGFFKIIFSLFAVGVTLLAVIGIVLGIKGYQMYDAAVTETPIQEKVLSICQQEDFVPYEELPDIYVDAVVAVEDQRFWTHHGIDCLAIGRALWNDIRTLSFAEGGSTITQQLMKNQYFTQEKTLERKFAEIFAAWEMEKTCTKQQILELYVNTVYFGSGYYGIQEATEGYFGKEAQELEDWEAVMLAGLPNAPSVYSLDENPQLAQQRMKQVLSRMVETEVLSSQQADEIFEQMESQL